MDVKRVLSGQIFEIWKNEYPLLFKETNPNLSIMHNPKRQCSSKRQTQFKVDGYFHEIKGISKFTAEIKQMANFMEYLVNENYSPAFLFASEAPWKLFQSLSDLFEETLGTTVVVPRVL